MANVTIYVSDEILKEVKKMESLNVSQVCQAALTEEVQRRKLPTVNPKGLEALRARILKEKEAAEGEAYQAGVKEAHDCATLTEKEMGCLDYADFAEAEKGEVAESRTVLWEEDSVFSVEYTDDQREAFKRGFVDALQDIKAKLDL